jgi:hypothetical protein
MGRPGGEERQRKVQGRKGKGREWRGHPGEKGIEKRRGKPGRERLGSLGFKIG